MLKITPELPKYIKSHYKEWIPFRHYLEKHDLKSLKDGRIVKASYLLDKLFPFISFFLKASGLYKKGIKNAKDIKVRSLDLSYPDLPEGFNGFKILHLTDLHLDVLPDLDQIIADKIRPLKYDICFITGDYRKENHGNYDHVIPMLEKVFNAINAEFGTYAILGNHDSHQMIDDLEKLGLETLVNESVVIERNGEEIVLTGVDDPNSFYSNKIVDALNNSNGQFKVLLAHSPEIAKLASVNNYRLYLAGHTHGGQICLPWGKPFVTHLNFEKDKFRGKWQDQNMVGYTSSGAGLSGLPLRYYTRGEVTLITLSRDNKIQSE